MEEISNGNSRKSSISRYIPAGALSALVIGLAFFGLVIHPAGALNNAPALTGAHDMSNLTSTVKQTGDIFGSAAGSSIDAAESNDQPDPISDPGTDAEIADDNNTTTAGQDTGADAEIADDNSTR